LHYIGAPADVKLFRAARRFKLFKETPLSPLKPFRSADLDAFPRSHPKKNSF
jgi:hypothetical protein